MADGGCVKAAAGISRALRVFAQTLSKYGFWFNERLWLGLFDPGDGPRVNQKSNVKLDDSINCSAVYANLSWNLETYALEG